MGKTRRRSHGDKFLLSFAETEQDINRFHSDAFDAKSGGMSPAVKQRSNAIRRTFKRKETHQAKMDIESEVDSSEIDVKKRSNRRFAYS